MSRTGKLVGIVGLARSGKDSVANQLRAHYDFTHTALFAGPLKEAAMSAFNLSRHEVSGVDYDRESIHPFWGISVREILQKLGTECMRDVFGADHWVRLMDKFLTDYESLNVVITDVRFDNEVEMLRSHGATILGVVRTAGQPPVREHPSEEMAANRMAEVTDTMIFAADLNELRMEVNRVFGTFE